MKAALAATILTGALVVSGASAGGSQNWKTQIQTQCAAVSERMIGTRSALLHHNIATAERKAERGYARAQACLKTLSAAPGNDDDDDD